MATASGIALIAVAAVLFSTRWLHTRSQAAVIAATFAYLVLVPASVGLALLVAARSAAWPLAGAVTIVILGIELRPWLHRVVPGETVLTVLTANVWFGRGDPRAVLDLAIAQEADLLALQETTEEFVAGLVDAGVDLLYPHSLVAAGPLWQGAALWSRRPLRAPLVTERGTLFRVEAVMRLGDTDAPDDPLVTSVHVHAPWPGPPGPWVDQLDEIGQQLAAGSAPMVIAGDFNATWDHAAFRRVLRHATDAAASARSWWVRTWPTHLRIPSVIAIDHVVLRGYRAGRVTTHRVPGADHAALVATVIRC